MPLPSHFHVATCALEAPQKSFENFASTRLQSGLEVCRSSARWFACCYCPDVLRPLSLRLSVNKVILLVVARFLKKKNKKEK
jgi:hypothetical protein